MAKQERHGASHKVTATRTQDQSTHQQKTQASAKTETGKRSSTNE